MSTAGDTITLSVLTEKCRNYIQHQYIVVMVTIILSLIIIYRWF
jgi:hypothetical protein